MILYILNITNSSRRPQRVLEWKVSKATPSRLNQSLRSRWFVLFVVCGCTWVCAWGVGRVIGSARVQSCMSFFRYYHTIWLFLRLEFSFGLKHVIWNPPVSTPQHWDCKHWLPCRWSLWEFWRPNLDAYACLASTSLTEPSPRPP